MAAVSQHLRQAVLTHAANEAQHPLVNGDPQSPQSQAACNGQDAGAAMATGSPVAHAHAAAATVANASDAVAKRAAALDSASDPATKPMPTDSPTADGTSAVAQATANGLNCTAEAAASGSPRQPSNKITDVSDTAWAAVLQTLDHQVKQVWDGLPRNALLMLYTCQGDTAEFRRLQVS